MTDRTKFYRKQNEKEISDVVLINFERVIAPRISNLLFSQKVSLKAESLKAFLRFSDG